MRRALLLAGCGVLSVSMTACESTEQESAKIGRESQSVEAKPAHAKPRKHSHHRARRSNAGAHHSVKGSSK
jgi:hypothetical protein